MSLYQLQKLLYELNRDPRVQADYLADRGEVLGRYRLDGDERAAVEGDDVGRLYRMGVNGQILMHFAAWRGFSWDAYIQAMKDAEA